MQMYADTAQNPILLSHHSRSTEMYVFYSSPHKNLSPHLTENMIVYKCTI